MDYKVKFKIRPLGLIDRPRQGSVIVLGAKDSIDATERAYDVVNRTFPKFKRGKWILAGLETLR